MMTSQPQKTFLFTDARHILCGDLRWSTPEGTPVPLIAPPAPQIDVQAHSGWLPCGIRLVAQKAKKTDPLPAGTKIGRIVFDHGLYRSWFLNPVYPAGRNYGAYSEDPALGLEICYTESKNGYDWTVPKGSPIDTKGCSGFDAFTFFIDPNGKSDEHYKAVFLGVPPKSDWPKLWHEYQKLPAYYRDLRLGPQEMACMYAAVSPDGITWKSTPGFLMIHKSDTDTTVTYNSDLQRYVMYTRLYKQNRRWVARTLSEDFYHWTPVEPLLLPPLDGPFSDDIYTNDYTTYPGEPGYHLLFPMIYHRYTQTSETQLYSSEDGLNWLKVPGGPVVVPGPVGDWDSEYIYTGNDLVPFGSDHIGMRYMATRFPHKYPRWPNVLEAGRTGWVTWPKGRLAAVVADEEGEFYMPMTIPAGKTLRANVRTQKAGMLRVALHDIPGRSIEECTPISGDHLDAPVHWNGDPAIPVDPGRTILLHFKLRAAELFGLEWV
jgi:hypothetical protein